MTKSELLRHMLAKLIEHRALALMMAIGLGPFLAAPLLVGRFIAVGMGC